MRKSLKFARSTLSTKFMLGMGAILICVITIISFLTYDYLKNIFIKETYQRTDTVLGYIDATMEYVREELRPPVFHALPDNIFIRQVMSSSFVNVGIMKRFIKRFPTYIYRRVAIDPMNPANKADAFEVGFIKKFRKSHAVKKQWRGIVIRKGAEYFLHLKAITMEKQCLLCHGAPASSPKSITLHYGSVHGRHWKVGEVVGIESIAAPVSDTLRQLRQVAFYFFLFGVAGTVMLFVALNYFHYRLAVVPLKRVSSFFKEVVDGHRGLDARFNTRDYDEVTELAESFNQMMGYLKKSEEEGKSMEERLWRADKLASIGQLAAGVAHEINNPLSLILGYTKMLRKECPAKGQTKEDLEVIYNNAMFCSKIVEDLLNFSHQKKPHRVSIEINASVDAAIRSLETVFQQNNIEVVRDYDPSLQSLMADEGQLQRVFSNLLMNSVQAMESNGSIRIETRPDREGGGILITFSDIGPGIPAAVVDKIFEPFFTTKPPGKGTGLGLAVSYAIVKEHGGEISVKSEEGAGATFTIWLPLEGEKE